MKHYHNKFKMFQSIMKKDNPIIVEVGAHYGEDSLRFSEIFKKAKIYCFEPDPRNIKIFKKYVNHPNIILYETALSNEEGEQEFFQSYDKIKGEVVPAKYDWINLEDYKKNLLSGSGASSLKKGFNQTLSESIRVKTERFDKWYRDQNISLIDLMWIDVQGAEKEVIEGMGNEISNIKFIWIEYGELFYEGALSKTETISLLNSKNFKKEAEYSNNNSSGDLLFFNTQMDMGQ
jgi:2-O-methyltransferase